jgi:hypothetical protein
MSCVADELSQAAKVCALLQISNRAKKLRRSTCCSTSKRLTPTLARPCEARSSSTLASGLGVKGLELDINDDIFERSSNRSFLRVEAQAHSTSSATFSNARRPRDPSTAKAKRRSTAKSYEPFGNMTPNSPSASPLILSEK